MMNMVFRRIFKHKGTENMKIIADVYDGSIFSLDNPIVLKRAVKIKYSNMTN